LATQLLPVLIGLWPPMAGLSHPGGVRTSTAHEGRAPSRPEEDGSDRAEPSKILEIAFWQTIGRKPAVCR